MDTDLHLIAAVFIFAASIIPIYLSFKLKNPLRRLTIVFAIFIIIHGFYHIFGSLNQEFISETVLAPMSAVALLIFGFIYLRLLTSKKEVKA